MLAPPEGKKEENQPVEIVDEVDKILEGRSGQIERSKGPMCRHGARSKCSHCLPADPYDEAYLAEKEIKHMSFHAYLKMVLHADMAGKSTRTSKPLENIVCRVKHGCGNHPPYPTAVCVKCQPDPVTLNRQKYRHVDNISFENDAIINRFLDFWRRTGHQRLGFLIGKYEPYAEAPLGIRATVSAIYEPPQWSTNGSVQLLNDPKEKEVDALSAELGLRRVGWIFTDLTPKDGAAGTVECTRNIESYLVSAEECITAGWFQNKYPNVCRYTNEGTFGSKFVTVIASGDATNHIHFSGYQVSNQCSALVLDDWLIPVIDTPELAYVHDDRKCVPDVKYMIKDKYGNQVTKEGRPLPVEYLLVDVPAGMPKDPQYTFYASDSKKALEVENREALAELQNLSTLKAYCSQFNLQNSDSVLEMFSNFHVLLYLRTNDTCHVDMESLKPLLKALKEKDQEAVSLWMKKNPDWATLNHLMEADVGTSGLAANQDVNMGDLAANGTASGIREPDIQEIPTDSNPWACAHCTFENQAKNRDCEMCSLPRNG